MPNEIGKLKIIITIKEKKERKAPNSPNASEHSQWLQKSSRSHSLLPLSYLSLNLSRFLDALTAETSPKMLNRCFLQQEERGGEIGRRRKRTSIT